MKKVYMKPEINTSAFAQFENVFTSCDKESNTCRKGKHGHGHGRSNGCEFSFYTYGGGHGYGGGRKSEFNDQGSHSGC